MIRLQDDLLGVYNSLTDFSNNTLLAPRQLPIRVSYSESLNSLCFEQKGLKVSVSALNYYCENLIKIKDSFLLPEDYDFLMMSMSGLINSGSLIHDRVCVAPREFGFSIYETKPGTMYLKEGPQLLGTFKFVSGNSWLFKKLTKFKYNL